MMPVASGFAPPQNFLRQQRTTPERDQAFGVRDHFRMQRPQPHLLGNAPCSLARMNWTRSLTTSSSGGNTFLNLQQRVGHGRVLRGR